MPCLGGAGRLTFMPETLCLELNVERLMVQRVLSVLGRVRVGIKPWRFRKLEHDSGEKRGCLGEFEIKERGERREGIFGT
jgi:hypothetical protein